MAKATQPKLLQRDLFVEVDERLLLKDNPALNTVAQALPEKPYIKPYDIMQVLPVREDVIYKWIRQFKFLYIDVGTGEQLARYAIDRKSFLAFLGTRVNHIR